MLTAGCLTLFLHVLPPFRPLISRLKRAEAVAVIEIDRVVANRIHFRSLHRLRGPLLKTAQLLPGHRPSPRAMRSLVTFRRRGDVWILQEQAREWVELDRNEWLKHPPATWVKWLKNLKSQPEKALIDSLANQPFARFAVRDLNVLLLQPKRHELRQHIADTLSRKRLETSLADSLRHHLLRGASRSEGKKLRRCMALGTGCLGR